MADVPVLRADGKVEFASAEALRQHFDTFLSKGGVMVLPERPPAAFETLDLTLISPVGAPSLAVKAQAVATTGSEVFLRFVDFDDGLRDRMKRLAEASSAPPVRSTPVPPIPVPFNPLPYTPTPRPSAAGSGIFAAASQTAAAQLSILPRGTFKNPALPKDFLGLPTVRPPTPSQLAVPPLGLVLQAIAARKELCTRLVLRSGANRQLELYSLGGAMLQLPVPDKSALATFAEHEGTYELSSSEPHQLRYSMTLGAAQFGLLRELVKQYVEPDLRAGMAGRLGLAPRLTPSGASLLRRFALSEAQNRVALRMLTGGHALDEVIYTGIGVRSTLQMLYLLEVIGGLEWVDPPPKTNLVVDELKATLERIRSADHFAILGLHLSTPPRVIERTFQRLKEMYGPGSVARRESAELTADIWTHIEAAYAVIQTPGGRKQYRKQHFPDVRLDYASALTYDQAMLSEMRQEWRQAIDLMEITIELNPTADYLAALRRVRDKQSQAALKRP